MLAYLMTLNLLMILSFAFIWWLLDVIGKWFMFVKMGEAGWKSLIPIYSDYVIFRNVWKPIYFIALIVVNVLAAYVSYSQGGGDTSSYLLNLLHCASFILVFLENIKLSRSFGHGYLFGLGLLIFNPLFTMILGFGSSIYLGNFSSD